ncbi:EAL domain-containing protein [Levilactobacillus parabrevis]|uniref:Diguanylate cyclase phosphodiesterase domain 2 containing protein n=1 Tax=Levilactobacillus parabrevis ATCC 53295 TaxID=1267003 RepID=A0A0R1GWL4_9LACO|nr:EAL domain-containing protein [Levilactobacillus parabrevis]KRK35079.1 diguanylate cyclase phosphodiesterase domain 2 containing protein [Levilactobacillus parabrevis ATCC 53295]KRO05109.1 diguanylate cyclase phosphodiesterase domain 2 containing protein [Levilactobacillus parabrevis]MCT4488216.1 EAL domain-containing protein [Levilactobacillus parabrevis]MCT4490394.1 EAL domain-containing protein [Levilactobacillus parabrevis]
MKPVYRYFVQPQIDTDTKTIFGYELLMKQMTPEGWRLPESFSAIDPQITADLLIATTKVLSLKVRYLSVNVNREQLMTTTIAKAIIKSQEQLYPTKLVVELTEDDGPQQYTIADLLPQLRSFINMGMQISLDDVGTGDNYFKDIQELLPLVSEVKFALQNFNREFKDPHIQQKIRFWRAISAEYGLRMVLEGIEDHADNRLSKQLGIKLKQGYYFSRPQLLKLPQDTCPA